MLPEATKSTCASCFQQEMVGFVLLRDKPPRLFSVDFLRTAAVTIPTWYLISTVFANFSLFKKNISFLAVLGLHFCMDFL